METFKEIFNLAIEHFGIFVLAGGLLLLVIHLGSFIPFGKVKEDNDEQSKKNSRKNGTILGVIFVILGFILPGGIIKINWYDDHFTNDTAESLNHKANPSLDSSYNFRKKTLSKGQIYKHPKTSFEFNFIDIYPENRIICNYTFPNGEKISDMVIGLDDFIDFPFEGKNFRFKIIDCSRVKKEISVEIIEFPFN